MSKQPRTTGPCWNCEAQLPLHILPGVRQTKCKCGAVHPHLSGRLVLRFLNPDKTTIYA
jgi:hypothetical protein